MAHADDPSPLSPRYRRALPIELDALYHRASQPHRAQWFHILAVTYFIHTRHAINDDTSKHIQPGAHRDHVRDVRGLAQACIYNQIQS